MAFLTEWLVNSVSDVVSNALSSAPAEVAAEAAAEAAGTVCGITAPTVLEGMSTCVVNGMSTLADAPAELVIEAAGEVVANLTDATAVAVAQAATEAATQTWGEFVSDWAYWLVGGTVTGAGAGAVAYNKTGQKPAVEAPAEAAKGMTAEQCRQAIEEMFYQTAAVEINQSEAFKRLLADANSLKAMNRDLLKGAAMVWLSKSTKRIQTAFDAMGPEQQTLVKEAFQAMTPEQKAAYEQLSEFKQVVFQRGLPKAVDLTKYLAELTARDLKAEAVYNKNNQIHAPKASVKP